MKLIINNFRCHKHLTVNLTPGEILFVCGLNGRGKSTIIHAILFALYGKIKDVIKKGSKRCSVTLVKGDMTIIRSKPGSHLTVTKGRSGDEFTGIEAQKIIDAEFDKDHAFISTCYIAQESLASLITASPKQRLEIIEYLLSDPRVTSVREGISKDIRKISSEQDKHFGAIKEIKEELETVALGSQKEPRKLFLDEPELKKEVTLLDRKKIELIHLEQSYLLYIENKRIQDELLELEDPEESFEHLTSLMTTLLEDIKRSEAWDLYEMTLKKIDERYPENISSWVLYPSVDRSMLDKLKESARLKTEIVKYLPISEPSVYISDETIEAKIRSMCLMKTIEHIDGDIILIPSYIKEKTELASKIELISRWNVYDKRMTDLKIGFPSGIAHKEIQKDRTEKTLEKYGEKMELRKKYGLLERIGEDMTREKAEKLLSEHRNFILWKETEEDRMKLDSSGNPPEDLLRKWLKLPFLMTPLKKSRRKRSADLYRKDRPTSKDLDSKEHWKLRCPTCSASIVLFPVSKTITEPEIDFEDSLRLPEHHKGGFSPMTHEKIHLFLLIHEKIKKLAIVTTDVPEEDLKRANLFLKWEKYIGKVKLSILKKQMSKLPDIDNPEEYMSSLEMNKKIREWKKKTKDLVRPKMTDIRPMADIEDKYTLLSSLISDLEKKKLVLDQRKGVEHSLEDLKKLKKEQEKWKEYTSLTKSLSSLAVSSEITEEEYLKKVLHNEKIRERKTLLMALPEPVHENPSREYVVIFDQIRTVKGQLSLIEKKKELDKKLKPCIVVKESSVMSLKKKISELQDIIMLNPERKSRWDEYHRFQRLTSRIKEHDTIFITNKLYLDNLTILMVKIREAQNLYLRDSLILINKELQNILNKMFIKEPIIAKLVYDPTKKTKSIDILVRYKGVKFNIGSLSGGERKKIALGIVLAMGCINGSQFLLLDEVLAPLDHSSRVSAEGAIKYAVEKRGLFAIVISHSISAESYDHVLKL